MHSEIQLRFEQLQNSKRHFEEVISAAAHNPHAAAEGEWSIAQVVEHLLASEKGTLGYMKKKSSGGWDVLEDEAEQHRVNSAAINARLESNERYKAPDVLPEPTNTLALDALLNTWNELRNEMDAFLEGVEPRHLHKLVFRQPAAGMLTVLQALEFMDAHLRHHIPQLERIMQS